ncbi:hypothetical protein NEOKW01_1090 [Nematocida sp. AWRm80]|nr:hypothetical protein NEOKW01_1090 [Nematocida sp. AWRm80]
MKSVSETAVEVESFWNKVFSILEMEITVGTLPREIEKVLMDGDKFEQITQLDLFGEMERIGCSNNRRNRVLFSILALGYYARALDLDESKREEVLEYINSRLWDVEKKIRENVIVFTLRHMTATKNYPIRKILIGIINLLKNKSSSIREHTLGIILKNKDKFLSYLTSVEETMLVKSLSIMLLAEAENVIGKDKGNTPLVYPMAKKVFGLLHHLYLNGSLTDKELYEFLSKVIYETDNSAIAAVSLLFESEICTDGYIHKLEYSPGTPLYSNLTAILRHFLNTNKEVYKYYFQRIFTEQTKYSLYTTANIIEQLSKSTFNLETEKIFKWSAEVLDKCIESPEYINEYNSNILELDQKQSYDRTAYLCCPLEYVIPLYCQYAYEYQEESKSNGILRLFSQCKEKRETVITSIYYQLIDLQKENAQGNIIHKQIVSHSTFSNQRKESISQILEDIPVDQKTLSTDAEMVIGNTIENLQVDTPVNKPMSTDKMDKADKVDNCLLCTNHTLNAWLERHVKEMWSIVYSTQDTEAFVCLVEHFNPFQLFSVLTVPNVMLPSNEAYAYMLLWYIYHLKTSSEPIELPWISEISFQSIVGPADFKPLFELSMVIYTYLLSETQNTNTLLTGLYAKLDLKVQEYLNRMVSEIRENRTALKERYAFLANVLNVMFIPIQEQSGHSMVQPVSLESKACMHLIKKNITVIMSISIYLFNSPEIPKLIELVIDYLISSESLHHLDIQPISEDDVNRVSEYGVRNKNTEKAFQNILRKYSLLVDLHNKQVSNQNTSLDKEMSTILEHSISTNLDTNIIDGDISLRSNHL